MRKRRHVAQRLYLAYTGLVIFLAISLTAGFRSSRENIEELIHGESRAGIPIDLKDPSYRISYVSPEASAAGIRSGDSLLEVAHRPFKGLSDLFVPFRRAHSSDRMTFKLQRQTSGAVEVIDAEVRLGPLRAGPVTLRDWIRSLVVVVAMPLVCMLVGFFVVA